MRSLTNSLVLAVLLCAPARLLLAQAAEPANHAGASRPASEAEVEQLRGEVAAQRQTIEELKAMVGKLLATKAEVMSNVSAQIRPVAASAITDASSLPVDARAEAAPHLMNAVLLEAEPMPAPEPI
jgi:hypothetical protein